MSESERMALALRGLINVVVGTILVYALFVIVDKYRSRPPLVGIADRALSIAAKLAIVATAAWLMVELPFDLRVSLPPVFVISLELSPLRWRQGFWNDLSLRVIAVAACCFTISEILFAWWR